ncbi:MAG: Sec-independent protein translocase subunit TatA/TatB [Pirellulales bacterium]
MSDPRLAAASHGVLQVPQMFAFMGLGTVELIIVAAVILLLFGSRLPRVMRSLGEGIVEFKRGVQGIEEDSSAKRSDGHH